MVTRQWATNATTLFTHSVLLVRRNIKSLNFLLLSVLSFSLIGCNQSTNMTPESTTDSVEQSSTQHTPQLTPPVAKKIPFPMTQHGQTRVDDYYWMRDDKRENPEILAHLEAENAYAKSQMAHTEAFQQVLFDEMIGRIEKDDSTVPFLQQGYWWITIYEGESEYPIYSRKKDVKDAKEEVLLNVNELAKGHDYFDIGRYSVSTNNQIMAYSSDTVGRRIYDIQFKDLVTGKLYADKLTGSNGSLIWANDNQHLFYIKRHPQTLLAYQVYRHKIGTEQSQDVLMYEEKDETFYTSISKSRDGRFIEINHTSNTTLGVSLLDASKPLGQFELLYPLVEGHEYTYENRQDWFYIYTNDNAKNFKIMKVKAQDSHDKSKWQEVLAHRENVFIEDFIVLNDYLVVEEKERGLTQIRVIELATGKTSMLPFNDPAYYATFSINKQMDSQKLRLEYSSMTTPDMVLEYDLKTLNAKTLKQDKVIGEFDSNWYGSERVFVKARDGKEVPVSLVYRKDKFKKDGTNPLYQYAYGSYGITVDPYFSASRISLLDRGVVFAIAHVRGGQLLGRVWYEDGKMMNKMNTFNDFIDVTKGLTQLGYADKNKVYAGGGSAGGLLMGAIANMAPELYLGIGADVPFVDVVTTMSDATIPLTTGEYGEWGNPADKEAYEYILSYSPYDQVAKQDYPHMLVTTGLHDSQVQYFEPMKWVAKLREYKTDNNKLLFVTNMEAGHGGSSGRFRAYKERALETAFFFDLVGITK